MQIHTVRSGDTVFSIARKYGAAPQKIIENNELLNPDRLIPGEKLVIFTPTRTYTVRGGDSLLDIASRFGVTESHLKRKNPHLSGGRTMYPGQILTVKGVEPKYGLGIANGCYYKGASKERLALAIPYLTYLTVGGARIRRGETEMILDDREPLKAAREGGVLPILRIYDDETEYGDKKRESMLRAAIDGGYRGISLAAYRGMREERERTEEHATRLAKMLSDNGMKLFIELDGNSDAPHSSVGDARIFYYDKCQLERIPSFDDGERRALTGYADKSGAERTLIDLSSTAYSGGEAMTKSEAVRLAAASGKEIEYDGALMLSGFEHAKYLGGKRETVRTVYEPPENIKAKLELIRELGFMGISFDIMHIPVEYLLMFDELFGIPEGQPDM